MIENEKILELIQEKFFREGFYKTTMDEIASGLRMSKKTVYKFFPSKEDLVKAIIKHFMSKMKDKIIPVLDSDKNAIEKLENLISILAKTYDRISPKMLDEMRRYLPSLWDEIDNFRTEMMFGNITKVINQGREEGLFLDYPTPIVMNMLVASVRSIVNPEFILHNNFSMNKAAQITFQILVGGILTERGKELFNKSLNENEQ